MVITCICRLLLCVMHIIPQMIEIVYHARWKEKVRPDVLLHFTPLQGIFSV